MTAAAPPGEALPGIASRSDFSAAVLWAVRRAVARPARELWFVDPNFGDWPLGEPALLGLLTTWLRLPQRRLMLLAEDYAGVLRRHPRFVRWQVDWSHAISAFTPPDEQASQLPCVLVDDGPVCVEVFDALHWRGRVSLEAHVARAWRQNVDALLQRSAPASPVRPLGL